MLAVDNRVLIDNRLLMKVEFVSSVEGVARERVTVATAGGIVHQTGTMAASEDLMSPLRIITNAEGVAQKSSLSVFFLL